MNLQFVTCVILRRDIPGWLLFIVNALLIKKLAFRLQFCSLHQSTHSIHETLLIYYILGLEFNNSGLGLCHVGGQGSEVGSRRLWRVARFRSSLQQSAMAVPWSQLRSECCPANVMCNVSLTSKVLSFRAWSSTVMMSHWHRPNPQEVKRGVQHTLQLWTEVHRGNKEKPRNPPQRTLGSHQMRRDGEVGHCRISLGETTSPPMGQHHNTL